MIHLLHTNFIFQCGYYNLVCKIYCYSLNTYSVTRGSKFPTHILLSLFG